MTHRIFTGTTDDLEVLVQLWDDDADGTAQVAFRTERGATWGVPIELTEQPS